jgi:hypothetical protein
LKESIETYLNTALPIVSKTQLELKTLSVRRKIAADWRNHNPAEFNAAARLGLAGRAKSAL